MITNEEYMNRKWGHLPTLKKIIEKAPFSGPNEPVASTSDTDTQRLARIAEISLTVHKLEGHFRARCDPQETLLPCEDLGRLLRDLEWAGSLFRVHADMVLRLEADLHEMRPR